MARSNGETTTLLLYRRQGALVRVLNEGIPLSTDEAARFAGHVFEHGARAVLFRAIDIPAAPANGLLQRVPCEQDSILTLPASKDAYLKSLGARTQSLLKNRLNKVRREHPSFRFDVYENGAIEPARVRALLDLQRQRAARKRGGIVPDPAEEQRVMQMLKRCGMLGLATIDGRCAAGSICYRHGDVVSARLLAHDAAYDLYRMGFLCAYLMCAACTEMPGLRQLNFGWGKEPYKFHLGAQARTLSDVVIYRDHAERLRLAPLALRLYLRGWMFQLRKFASRNELKA